MSRILVVEDDPAILRGLADNLGFESHEVITATDGETACALIRERKPDLIVLDLMLPRISGYEVCRAVRRDGVTTPIVILTGLRNRANEDRLELWLVPIDDAGGRPRRFDVEAENWVLPGGGFAIHPDGERVAFVATAGMHRDEIWALGNLTPALKPAR
ncbi:MAG: response regulator [Acidobacteria bacterium]|nr:response regulator [Acidobacteriota bacterium]